MGMVSRKKILEFFVKDSQQVKLSNLMILEKYQALALEVRHLRPLAMSVILQSLQRFLKQNWPTLHYSEMDK